MIIFDSEIEGIEFLESVYELAFGDDAINKDYSSAEVIERLREMVANGDHND
jgi:hypothetical protein